jgi:uncharacterized membrane protein HdeD (DUF308 family)
MSDPSAAPDRRPGHPMWWLVLVRGSVALLLGASVLVSGKTRPALGNFIAVYWLIGSLLTFRWLAAHRQHERSRVVLAAAIVGTLAALVALLRFPLERVVSQELVIRLLGVVAILTGLLRLGGGLRDDELSLDRPRLPHRVGLGGLELALGAALLLTREVTRRAAIAAGLWGLVGGTILLLDALALRRGVTRAGGPGREERK